MAEQKYPIGIQTFSEIIEGGYTYVDKTRFVGKLIKEGKYIFLSRPRRFGKSLLLSTIHAYFDGHRSLFKNLAIDSMDMDWIPTPVLHFDLNTIDKNREDGLELMLDGLMRDYEDIYGKRESDITISQRFQYVIKSAFEKTGQKVAILVDEYDKPLLELDEDSELYQKNQATLKSFFSSLKSMDQYIRFAMLSGVARFSKVSIFSDLNNLKDISMFERYQEICGWTEEELRKNFMSGIESLAQNRDESSEKTLEELRIFYDGYLFSEKGNRLYNPFSVLMALDSRTIKPFWFDTGTPTFLAKRIKKSGIYPASINGQTRDYEDLVAVGTGSGNIIALMFQTGYLTIDSYDIRRKRYKLRFPNREVEIGFGRFLLPLYAPSTKKIDSPFNLHNFVDDLYDGDPDAFMKRLETLIKSLPYEDQNESTYRAITFLLCLLSGTEANPEHHSYKGRSDLEVQTPDYIYIFEFKYNKTVKEAVDQINDRDYSGRYALDSRKLFLIGANFTDDKNSRGLDYEIL